MNIKERIVNIYHSSENIVNNFKKNGDPEQVGYSLLVSAVIYGLIPVQALGGLAIMKALESINFVNPEALGILAISMYGLSKLTIYQMNKKMLESKKGWSADLHTNAFSYAGLRPKKAAALGTVSEFIIGTIANPVDWAALGSLIAGPIIGSDNQLAASIFLSKSLLLPAYFTAANLLIRTGSVDPVLSGIRKVRNSLIRK